MPMDVGQSWPSPADSRMSDTSPGDHAGKGPYWSQQDGRGAPSGPTSNWRERVT